MTPVIDIMAGLLCGTLMGLIASAHAAFLFSFNPPSLLRRRIEEGKATGPMMLAMLAIIVAWTFLGVIAGLIADVAIPEGTARSLVPSPGYLTMVLVLLTIVGAPILMVFRDRWRHVIFGWVLSLSIFGVLIPVMVVALQSRQ